MIIRTKRITSKGEGSQGETKIQTAEEKKPGESFKQKVVKSYKTRIKPGLSKAVSEAKEDFSEMFVK